MDDYPAIFMSHRLSFGLRRSWYKNYKPHVYSYGLYKYRRIDEADRNGYKERLKELEKKKK